MKRLILIYVVIWCLFPFLEGEIYAASCCGGGGGGGTTLAKGDMNTIDFSLAEEIYDGYWNSDGEHFDDPPGSDLRQYRANLAYARRLANRWQASISSGYVYNYNKYGSETFSNQGMGDTTVSLWYEDFDKIQCITEIWSLWDLVPSIYYGLGLLIPTGISPYDDVESSFEITGRGFYRLDFQINMVKSIGNFNFGLLGAYGIYFERPVNREWGHYVKPYNKKLGDRQSLSFSTGHGWSFRDFSTFSLTAAWAYFQEAETEYNGVKAEGTDTEKHSLSLSGSWMDMDQVWKVRFSIAQAMSGRNFPRTQTHTVGLSYVF